jgi:putative transposase
MPELRHHDHDGRVRFVTFSTHRRLPILTNNEFRAHVVRAIEVARDHHRFRLLAYVIMPEHVRLVIFPQRESQVGEIIGEIKELAAKPILETLRERHSARLPRLSVTRDGITRFAVWEKRCYDHNCREDKDVGEKIAYCHRNPVTRGLVTDPAQWRYSSFAASCGVTHAPLEIDEPIFDDSSHPSGGAPWLLNQR